MSMRTPMRAGGPATVVAVLGLGEAGSQIAADLVAAGAVVRGFDPRVTGGAGVVNCSSDADACRDASLVLSLTCAHEAENALASALPGIGRTAIYADMNTASSQLKAQLADRAAAAGIAFADVALMSPVPGNGLGTPMLACGPADEMTAAVELLTHLGVPPRVATASARWLEQLRAEQAEVQRPDSAAIP
jgi:3-hydroxyisobutyrate dehydrogenase-like beta-hydroxyacid dehydrogenase